jgi:hypothetical protein
LDIHNSRVYRFCLSYSSGNLGQVKKRKKKYQSEMTTHSRIKTQEIDSEVDPMS